MLVARRRKTLPKSADPAMRPPIFPTARPAQSLTRAARTRVRVRVQYAPSFAGTAFAIPSAVLVASALRIITYMLVVEARDR